MQPLVIHRRRSNEPTAIIEAIYQFADALKAAQKAMDEIPCPSRADLDELLDSAVERGDYDSLSKKVYAIAEHWQGLIDAEEGDR
jgi:hypothetical protein